MSPIANSPHTSGLFHPSLSDSPHSHEMYRIVLEGRLTLAPDENLQVRYLRTPTLVECSHGC